MNRIIKFRGKDTFKSDYFPAKWWYGGIMIDGEDAWLCAKKENNGIVSVKIIPETIGQFTGLTDKNGTEIYEGDIICTHLNVVVVKWGYKEHIVKHHRIVDSIAAYGWIVESVANGLTDFLDNEFLQGEVIGNIYDNPELLKK